MASKTPISNNGIAPNPKQPPLSSEILKVAKVALLDLPTAALKRIVAGGSERDLYEATWAAYDSVIGLVNEATNRTYTNQSVGEFASRVIDFSLQWQRFNAAVAGAFFANLWPAINLPTATEVEGMRSELRSLRAELRGAIAERESASTRREREALPEMRVTEHLVAKRPAAERHSNVFQVAVWSGWPNAETKEVIQNGRN
ncbi:MAG: hypothetical protein Q7S58_00020 [Candidatus Binatus sp.]|uniref:hypothetical protein n=1 Tax=Candidatus Binatus sp. TaxID=2811406 RepID=UPI00272700E0|nr:hypothetical protein [Candidatus Binatus sp.]MDO8430771.1 hypothetical protein [Candidatus Binatus sp.]